jgi:hypothetical protein
LDSPAPSPSPSIFNPVPGDTAIVEWLFGILGIPTVVISLVVIAMSIESLYARGRQVARGAVLAHRAAGHAGSWLVRQPPVRVLLIGLSTACVLAAQAVMLGLSYIAGSFLASPFDPGRSEVLLDAVQHSPILLIDPGFISANTRLDWISAVFVLWTLVWLIAGYGVRDGAGALTGFMAFPFWFFAFGSGVWVVLSVAVDLLFGILTWTFTGSEAWTVTRGTFAQGMVGIAAWSLGYSLACLAALSATGVLFKTWGGTKSDPI